MNIHLLDGTYELFRAYYGLPSIKAPDGREVGATRGSDSDACWFCCGRKT